MDSRRVPWPLLCSALGLALELLAGCSALDPGATDAGPVAGAVDAESREARNAADARPPDRLGAAPADAGCLPAPTTRVVLRGNLDADAAVSTFSPSAPAATSVFAVALSLHDSNGAAHPAAIHVARIGVGSFSWHVLVDGSALTGGAVGSPVVAAHGKLVFDAKGALASTTTESNAFDFVAAVQNQAIDFDFGAVGGSGTTSFAAPSTLTTLGQDGRACSD
jgi:hypothetical protein